MFSGGEKLLDNLIFPAGKTNSYMFEVVQILSQISREDREALGKVIGARNSSPNSIVDAITWNSHSIFSHLMGRQPEYTAVVKKVARKLKIKYSRVEPTPQIEMKIAQKVYAKFWEDLSPEQRVKLEKEITSAAKAYGSNGAFVQSSAIAGGITVAQLSGFGVYMFASSFMGAVTGAVGLTLPFAFYTTMSSTIAVLIGPVGWIGLGLFAIWRMTGAKYKKLIPAIMVINALRAKSNGTFPALR